MAAGTNRQTPEESLVTGRKTAAIPMLPVKPRGTNQVVKGGNDLCDLFEQRMKKVLVADDQASSRELIRTVLEQSGHRGWEAADGTEAVRFAREVLPDLIVLDLRMPMLDGFEVLDQLRRDENLIGTPIVAITAAAMQGECQRALSAGFASYIAKPTSLRALRSAMERWLG